MSDANTISPQAQAAAGPQWPLTITLRVPVPYGRDTTVDTLTFQKGNFGVLKGMSIDRTPNVDELITIAARLCGRPLKVIESLDPSDIKEVVAIALGFFAQCLTDGKLP